MSKLVHEVGKIMRAPNALAQQRVYNNSRAFCSQIIASENGRLDRRRLIARSSCREQHRSQ
jgi:hypothetical protein